MAAILFLVFSLTLGSRICAQTVITDANTLTEYPADIPSDTVSLTININEISYIPEDAFEHLFQLYEFKLYKNPIKQMPNLIPVGSTLEVLNFKNVYLPTLNATIFSALRVLRVLLLGNCGLLELPHVAHGPPESLERVILINNKLTSLARVVPGKYSLLSGVLLSDNPMTGEMEEAELERVAKLRELDVADTGVTGLPEAPQLLTKVFRLNVARTGVSVVPLTCPVAELEVVAEQTPVSVCRCENVWLVSLHGQRGSVTLDAMDCDGATTTQELLEQRCQEHTRKKTKRMAKKYADFFCSFPVHTYIQDVIKEDCAILCAATLGCRSFGFRVTSTTHGDGDVGNCVIIAPTDAALTNIPDAGVSGWNYYN